MTSETEQISTRLRRRTAAEDVAERLRTEINSGFLRLGERLLQNDTARRLGVSTTPVREAFAILHAAGLVRLDRHRGAVVFRPTVEELVELFDIRGPMEDLGLRRAVPRMTAEVIAKLEQLLARMVCARTPAESYRPHLEFHNTIFSQSGMPRLSGLIADLREASTQYSFAQLAAGRTFAEQNKEHASMIEALRRLDVEEMRRLNGVHLQLTIAAAVRAFTEQAEDEVTPRAG